MGFENSQEPSPEAMAFMSRELKKTGLEEHFKNQYLQVPPSSEVFVVRGRGVHGPFSKEVSADGFVYLGSVTMAERVAELCNDVWKRSRV